MNKPAWIWVEYQDENNSICRVKIRTDRIIAMSIRNNGGINITTQDFPRIRFYSTGQLEGLWYIPDEIIKILSPDNLIKGE